MPRISTSRIIRKINHNPKKNLSFFLDQDLKKQPKLLLKLSPNAQRELLLNLDQSLVLNLLEKLQPDDTTDLLQTLPVRKQKELLHKLNQELQNKVSLLLRFDPHTAAGLISLNYLQLDHNLTLSQAALKIRTHEKRTGKTPVPLVLKDHQLIGYLPIEKLLFTKPSDPIGQYTKKITTLKPNESRKKVINLFLSNPHKKITVLNEDGSILGIIYSDDVIKTLKNSSTNSLYDFAGVHDEETVFDTATRKVGFRYKWLIINLLTSFLAASTVSLFDNTISKYVLLAVYMPIIAGMGGNAATQTLAVIVRGITLKQINLKTCLPTLRREIVAAFVNGLINAILIALVVIAINRDFKIAFILSLAMVANLLVAAVFGTLIPLIMKKLGKDPATSATIFITTATDVLGFLIFLGLATLILT